ncbi:MAG: sugar phosphate isomerase/epimerase [Candidatus Omnitrophica bacterium]|nr:sugar phosphate isomerase/epimerase [Candidatus Omnitrophota bacterium]
MIGSNISFRNYFEEVKNLKENGYKYVYFDGDFLIDTKNRQLEDIFKLIKDFELIPFSLHNLWTFPEDIRKIDDFISLQENFFEKAKILDVKYLTYHFGLPIDIQPKEDFNFETYLRRKDIKKDDYRNMNIEILNILCEKAKNYNLSLTIENLPPKCLCDFSTNFEDILNIIKEVKKDNIGICFDSGHANIAGIDLYHFILKCRDKLFETHFHDNFGYIKDDNSINDLHQPCGIGNINWMKIIKGLEEINFKNPVIFEIGSNYEVLNINKNNWFKFHSIYKNRLKENF